MWDPQTYLAYADERSRPFGELVARIRVDDARRVVDLGCGPGHLSHVLRARWPRATVVGVDASAQMVAQARADDDDPRTRYELADLRTWRAVDPVDVLVTNAALQWVPGHLDLLPALQDAVGPGGALALGVPGNFDAPSHVLLRELARRSDFAPHLREVVHPAAHDAATYLDALARPGWVVDAWETTYLHVLRGPDPVLRWVQGTGARPVLAALPPGLRTRFEAGYGAALRTAYPAGRNGTVLPFRRVFAVAHRARGD